MCLKGQFTEKIKLVFVKAIVKTNKTKIPIIIIVELAPVRPSSKVVTKALGISAAIPENIIPDTDNSRALGSASKRWSTLHSQTLNTGDIIMKNDNGHFTLDEQNGYIRVFNHITNKFYRILMEEI